MKIHPLKITGLLLFLFVLTGCAKSSDRVSSSFQSVTDSGLLVAADAASHDWGDIDIAGGNVAHTFTLKNDSTENLYLKGAQTSCMCTTARYLLPDGAPSPKYGLHNNPNTWAAQIKPGETFDVEVVFDPMAHGPEATGPIQRSIFLITSSRQGSPLIKKEMRAPNGSIAELTLAGNVLSERVYQSKKAKKPSGDFVMGDFVFDEKEFDFGVIKQSGDIVTHDFLFTYKGEKPVTITGTPTSCACTSATVSKTDLQPGDSATLTVRFDPNLHEEPKGRFFKTVSILTDPAAENPPEVKIWAEVDLDLGPEAYKLKEEHKD